MYREKIDDRTDYGEIRIIATGTIAGRLCVCVYTWRDGIPAALFLYEKRTGEKPMPTIKAKSSTAAKALKIFDWSRVDAMTDASIARQIASNPDAAPDISSALKHGSMRRPVKPEHIKAVRRKTGLSQSRFAERLSLHVATIRNWEQGRTRPDGAALTLLAVINREPKMVMRALQN